jgi:hypothetical protein
MESYPCDSVLYLEITKPVGPIIKTADLKLIVRFPPTSGLFDPHPRCPLRATRLGSGVETGLGSVVLAQQRYRSCIGRANSTKFMAIEAET